MKTDIFKLLLLSGAISMGASASAQVDLVKEGKSKSKIVLAERTEVNRTAATILQDFVQKISGCKLDIKEKGKAGQGDILIGSSTSSSLQEDGYQLSTTGGKLVITGKDNGPVYGVVSLLEDYLGVDYWGNGEYNLEKRTTISLPSIEKTDNPAFRYRQTQNYAIATDSLYKWWYRLEEPDEVFAANYWVHTFNRLLPVEEYGEKHPEYYAYFDGKRHPGAQWCLTNPEVFEIVSQRIDSIFKANPDQKIISVSQNDGNNTNCTCPECKKLDDAAGSPSGSLIYFMNKLAKRFPDKEISTLAYLYTMNPPKNVKPEPNVVVMLCDIDCDREVSLTENASGQYFMKALKGWSDITDNIFLWDYGINFDCYLSPFPNLYIMQDNIRTFRDHHVKMHFSQVASSYGGDFAELRSYIASKLMWNPDVDVDRVIKHFLQSYYGAASDYLYQYIQLVQGALWGSGHRLWIYDSPVSHKEGMLNPVLMKRYRAIFDKAEAAVADDPVALDRVRRTRLPLLYSELELLRAQQEKDFDEVAQKLNYFEEQAKHFNNPAINERNNRALDYCKLYRERYMPSTEKNLALGATVTYLVNPESKYVELGKTALTDGLFGGASFMESWVGWEGKDAAFVVDLGETKEVRSIDTDFLHQIGQWILFPLKVVYSYSEDGKTYHPWETIEMPEECAGMVMYRGVKAESQTPLKARYLKVEVTGTKVCPTWHYGVGNPSWFFIDEVTVR